MYRCQHNKASRYLMDHCTSVSDVAYGQRLRSTSSHEVSVPRHRLSTTYYLWTSTSCRHWPDCLEFFFARWRTGSGGFWGQLQAVTEDVFICAVLVCTAYQRFFFTRMRYINPHLTLTLTCGVRTHQASRGLSVIAGLSCYLDVLSRIHNDIAIFLVGSRGC